MKSTKIFIAAALASIMTLTTGCAFPDATYDPVAPTTNQFKQGDNSYAMNILNAGWGGDIPFHISDTVIPEDALDGNSNADLYVTQAALGTLANGLIGGALGLASVALFTPSNHYPEQAEFFIWLPANGRDINDIKTRNELKSEITTDYLEPMYKSFLAATHSGHIVSSTKGSFSYKGVSCTNKDSNKDPEKICDVNLTSSMNRFVYQLRFASYADKQHGLPFKTNSDGKFIIVRLRVLTYDLVTFNKKDNLFFYIPAGSSRYPNNYQYTNTPYIRSSTDNYFFAKVAHKIND